VVDTGHRTLDEEEPMGNPTPPTAETEAAVDWEGVQVSPEFGRLRHAVRSFVFPVTVLFLVWYFLYVLLADYAHGFMSTKLWGNFNVGLLLGVLQFVSTFLIAIWYSRYANKKMDPLADELRGQIVGPTEEDGR
jgi:uncharacterized membrane protein (DUF485 family)